LKPVAQVDDVTIDRSQVCLIEEKENKYRTTEKGTEALRRSASS